MKRVLLLTLLLSTLVACSNGNSIPKGIDEEFYLATLDVIDILDSLVKEPRKIEQEKGLFILEYYDMYLTSFNDDLEGLQQKVKLEMVFATGLLFMHKFDIQKEEALEDLNEYLLNVKKMLSIK